MENSPFSCYINVSDFGEPNNVTLNANIYSPPPVSQWFVFNNTNTNIITEPMNFTTNFSASYLVNFTPTDIAVGNWTINITATNSFGLTNTTTINFYVGNVTENVTLQNISNVSVYVPDNPHIPLYVNATDGNLLIPNHSIFNVSMLNVTSNVSWVNISSVTYISGTNVSTIKIDIYPNVTLENKVYEVNINVSVFGGISSSRVFWINVSTNIPPSWSFIPVSNLTEGIPFSLNLANYVSFGSSTNVNYSINYPNDCSLPYQDLNCFTSITVNPATGLINDIPTGFDVGIHSLSINVTDPKNATATAVFIFNVSAFVMPPVILNISNSTSYSCSNCNIPNYSIIGNYMVNTSEDTPVTLYLKVIDPNLDVAPIQRSTYGSGIYNENLTLNMTLQGPNTSLLSFSSISPSNIPYAWNPLYNFSIYYATFTPRKLDVGIYNIAVNVTNAGGNSTVYFFNMTINAIHHAPSLSAIPNLSISIIDSNFTYYTNATDVEDGNISSGNLTFIIKSLTAGGNFLNITSKTGIITNGTALPLEAGIWNYSVIVNDTVNLNATQNFTLFVYNYPTVIFPNSNYIFNLIEGQSSLVNFLLNQSVSDYDNFSLYLNGNLIYQNSTFINGTNVSTNVVTPYGSRTTCTGPINLTLNVSNIKLTNATSWNVNIAHVLSSLTNSSIPSFSSPSGVPIVIDLSQYFADYDAQDSCFNQTVSFIINPPYFVSSSALLTASNLSNWVNGTDPSVTFYSSGVIASNFSITAIQYNESNPSQQITNITSNNFSISFLALPTTSTPTPSSGSSGGGGTSVTQEIVDVTQPQFLDIIVPNPLTVDQNDTLVLPIQLLNTGSVTLHNISLSSSVALNGSLVNGINVSFDQSKFGSLAPGQEVNVNMTTALNVELQGLYEVTINATVVNPNYSAWGKVYLTVQEGGDVERQILFVDQMIIGNPVCAEVQENVNQAKSYLSADDVKDAQTSLNEAIYGCQKLIEQGASITPTANTQNKIVLYAVFAGILAVILGFGIYAYERFRLRKEIMSEDSE